MIGLWWAACGGGDVEVPVVVPPPAAARPELEPFRGRWLSVRQQSDQSWVVCTGGPTMEFREEGNRWDLVLSTADALRVAPIGTATPTPTGIHLEADGVVDLTWVEPHRIASFGTLVEAQSFASPQVGRTLPSAVCGP